MSFTATAILLAATSAGPLSAANTSPQPRTCADAVGADWEFEAANGDLAGDRYKVAVIGGVACSFARGWVTQLTRTVPGSAGNAYVINGPLGWRCVGEPPTLYGDCATLKSTAQQPVAFRWEFDPGSRR